MNLDPKGILVGMVFGAACAVLVAATTIFPKLDAELDAARATIDQQRDEIHQLQGKLAAATAERDTLQAMLTAVKVNTYPAASQSSPLELLNVVRPGLGTLAVAADRAMKNAQAGQCPTGSEPQTSPAWQGAKCVEVTPQQ
jgi:hypothetical protein